MRQPIIPARARAYLMCETSTRADHAGMRARVWFRSVSMALMILGACAFSRAQAQTFDMSYIGVDSQDYTDGATGFGSLTLDGSGMLTAFTLTIDQVCSVDACGTPLETDVFTYGLNNVETFAATVSNGQIESLSLTTDQQPGFYTPDTAFVVGSLGASGAVTTDLDTGSLTAGTLTVSPTQSAPEPATASILMAGLLGLFGLRATARRQASVR